MRKQSAFVALLVSGCFSDPAYIGEGPGADTGGSGGTSGTGSSGTGTGSSGTGTGSSGTSGTASGGAGMGGVGSGVPIQGGNGGAPGAGSALPLQSGSCRMTRSELYLAAPDREEVITWDADTRTLAVEGIEYSFDESARLVELWFEESQFRGRIEYDAMSTPTRVIHTSEGDELTSASWEQTNVYESGRLFESMLEYHDGSFEHIGYADNDGPPTAVVRDLVSEVATTRIYHDIRYELGRPNIFLTTLDDREAEHRTAMYDSTGRLLQTDWDDGLIGTGLDGSVENREKWFYDDAGRIIRHEVDFKSEEPWPAPLDGAPDMITTFEPECAPIAVSLHHVYGFPAWLFPYGSIFGWNF